MGDDDEHCLYCYNLEDIVLYEVKETINIPLQDWYKEREDLKTKEEKEKKEQEELKELERLKISTKNKKGYAMKFKPMLAPNDEPDLNNIKYPILASYKLDGIRCIFKYGEMLSRSLKPIVNKQIKEKFEPLRLFSEKEHLILDGELYNPDIPFQAISSCVMTQDYNDKKAIKKWGEICEEHNLDITREEALKEFKFYLFDALEDDFTMDFMDRDCFCEEIAEDFKELIVPVKQIRINSKKEVEEYFEIALKEGFEGLILKDGNGKYKCGRGTLKEGLIYKVKPFRTFDAQIIGVVQATKVNPNAEKKINELGRSVTSKKKDDRILIEKASAFIVKYEDEEVKPTLSMTDPEKGEVWRNRNSYIGKWIEYKGMLVGAKSVPRHPTFIRFRSDLDTN